MKMPSAKVMLFNAAAIMVGLAAVFSVIRSLVVTSTVTPCSDRYQTAMTFPLERNGAAVTAMDIQARAGGRDAGLLENLEVVRLDKGPAPVVLRVSLPKGSGAPDTSVEPKGGISFPWQPRSVREQAAVCLSYQVYLPDDFDFGLGGALPGILGRAEDSDDHFLVQPRWRPGGSIASTNVMTMSGKKWKQVAEGDGSAIPRGRWVKVEQEVVLNAPGQENGSLRVWMDGALAIDRTDLAYRDKSDVGLRGVAADIYYSGDDLMARAPADAKVMVSPFEMRWR